MYKPTEASLWTGRVDEEDGVDGLRWHQVVELVHIYQQKLDDSRKGDFAVLGFSSEEGVRRNKGRLGAAEGPGQLRKTLSSMAWHHSQGRKFLDVGDIIPSGDRLEEAQEQLGKVSGKLMKKGYLPIVLGGGHEVAWASFQGYLHSQYKGESLGVINFDAHFDLRKAGKASSGTPFLQIANWCHENHEPFHYLCLGIQKYGNTKALFDTADALGVEYVFANDISGRNLDSIEEKLSSFFQKVDHLYLSIDLDGFDAAFAPGVSAPSAGGMIPNDVMGLLQIIAKSGKLRMMDVAELNPSFDQDMRTAKLGARCIFEVTSVFFP